MTATIEDREPMFVVGLEIRTSNELEMSEKGKIPALWSRVRSEPLFERVPHVSEAGTILAVYSSYEDQARGDYSFLLGVPVTRIGEQLPAGMVSHSSPAARVAVLHTAKGPLPAVLVDLWKKVWKMTPKELGGRRAFTFDIERYDERARDANNAEVELTLSVE